MILLEERNGKILKQLIAADDTQRPIHLSLWLLYSINLDLYLLFKLNEIHLIFFYI